MLGGCVIIQERQKEDCEPVCTPRHLTSRWRDQHEAAIPNPFQYACGHKPLWPCKCGVRASSGVIMGETLVKWSDAWIDQGEVVYSVRLHVRVHLWRITLKSAGAKARNSPLWRLSKQIELLIGYQPSDRDWRGQPCRTQTASFIPQESTPIRVSITVKRRVRPEKQVGRQQI